MHAVGGHVELNHATRRATGEHDLVDGVGAQRRLVALAIVALHHNRQRRAASDVELLGKGLAHKLEHVGLVEVGICRQESQVTKRKTQNRNLQRPHETRRPKQGAIATQGDDEVNAL